MLLGRTFDYSKSAVGIDIYDANVRDNPVVRHHEKSNMKSKLIKSTEDVRDVLDVSGQMSLKVMAGALNVEGKGSYLKSSIESGNTIEVLTQIYYRTVSWKALNNVGSGYPDGRVFSGNYLRKYNT